MWTSAAITIAKDLRLEWRTRARLNALVFFAVATLLMFSFALGADTAALRRHAGGYLWIAMMLASVLALGESFRVERENRALEGLLLLPADPRGVFLGKAIANALLLSLLGVVLIPVMVALYDLHLGELGGLAVLELFASVLLGASAISAPGTLVAAMTSSARARDVLLPLLLFPLLVPALLAAVKATSLVLVGDPMQDVSVWFALLGCVNALFWPLGFILFPAIVDD
jgi:heme exporter protein B